MRFGVFFSISGINLIKAIRERSPRNELKFATVAESLTTFTSGASKAVKVERTDVQNLQAVGELRKLEQQADIRRSVLVSEYTHDPRFSGMGSETTLRTATIRERI
jgi:hypothetical protein